MSSEPVPPKHLGIQPPAIAEAIEEAHLLISSLEEQIKLESLTTQPKTGIVAANEQLSPLEEDTFLAE